MYKTRAWQVKLVLFSFLFAILFSCQDSAQAITAKEFLGPDMIGGYIGMAIAMAISVPCGLTMLGGAALGVVGTIVGAAIGKFIGDKFSGNSDKEKLDCQFSIQQHSTKKATEVNEAVNEDNIQNLGLAQLEMRYKKAYSKYKDAISSGNQENILELAENLKQAKEAYEGALP